MNNLITPRTKNLHEVERWKVSNDGNALEATVTVMCPPRRVRRRVKPLCGFGTRNWTTRWSERELVVVKQAALDGPQWVSTVGSTLTYSSLDRRKSPHEGLRAEFRQDGGTLPGTAYLPALCA